MLLWGSAPAPCCTHGQQGSTSPIHVQIILLESNLWVWFPSGQGAVLLLSLSQEHRWCGGFFIFFSPEAKGRTPRKGREGKGQRWKEGICRKIFPQLHLPSPPGDGRVTDRSCSLQKNFRRFPGIPKHSGLGGPDVAGALLKKTNLAQPAANSVPIPSCGCNWYPEHF